MLTTQSVARTALCFTRLYVHIIYYLIEKQIYFVVGDSTEITLRQITWIVVSNRLGAVATCNEWDPYDRDIPNHPNYCDSSSITSSQTKNMLIMFKTSVQLQLLDALVAHPSTHETSDWARTTMAQSMAFTTSLGASQKKSREASTSTLISQTMSASTTWSSRGRCRS